MDISKQNSGSLALNGTRRTGQPVRNELVQTVQTVSNILKSSLGPVGLDKMLVDELGDIIVTNDGATILNRLEVEHPAAKMLVDLAKLQDDEVGDGTTSVVILASELLKRANNIVQMKIHPTNIIAGFKLASREAIKYIKSNLAIKTDSLGPEAIYNIARTSMSSKILSGEIDHFAKICVDAIQSVKTVNDIGDYTYPVKAVSILKQHGKSARESQLVDGFALNCTRASQAMPTYIKDAKIALLDFDLRVTKLKLGIQIVVQDPRELEAIRKREIDITKERIMKIVNAGANVILTTKGIDDVSMKYMVEAGVIGVRRCKKDDLKRIAKACGGSILLSLASTESADGEESFDASALGSAESVAETRFADDECMIIKGGSRGTSSSIILRGANCFMLDEMERSMNDALQAVKRTLEANMVVPGGGAVEVALSIYLENFAYTLGSREQQAIAEFAESLLVIPKQLAINAALDSVDLVAKLRVAHHQSQSGEGKGSNKQQYGLDLLDGVAKNMVEHGVLEPATSKIKSLGFATEAAISIMRIDDIIQLNPKEEPEQGHHH